MKTLAYFWIAFPVHQVCVRKKTFLWPKYIICRTFFGFIIFLNWQYYANNMFLNIFELPITFKKEKGKGFPVKKGEDFLKTDH